jgi:hypothetical protein
MPEQFTQHTSPSFMKKSFDKLLMKFLYSLLLLICFNVQASELVNYQQFKAFPKAQQINIIQAYRDFAREMAKNQLELSMVRSMFTPSIIEEAIAQAPYNCFYAGWPSLQKTVMVDGKKKTICTNPANANDSYKSLAKTCGDKQMLCQPILFGKNLCVSVATAPLRNAAFSQCETQFEKSARSIEDVIKDIAENDLASEAEELFSYVHKVCEVEKFQSDRPMCTNLKAKVAVIKSIAPAKTVPFIATPDEKAFIEPIKLLQSINEVINKPSIEELCKLEPEVTAKREISSLEALNSAIKTSSSTPDDFCAAGMEGALHGKITESHSPGEEDDASFDFKYHSSDDGRKLVGLNINSYDYGPKLKSFDDDSSLTPRRTYNYNFAGGLKENSFSVTDAPIREKFHKGVVADRFISSDLRTTTYTFFPRKRPPAIQKSESEVKITLTTGEEIIVDAKTGRIKSGKAKETAAKDAVKYRASDKLIYPEADFQYEGDGLFIVSKLDHRKDEQRPGNQVSVKAYANGQLQECSLEAEQIWEKKFGYYLPKEHPKYLSSYWSCTKIKFDRDEELYEMIRKKCPGFQFPELVQ